jgi:TonB-dependent Receptor Plug Domain
MSLALREFESRRERGLGQFITAAQIDSALGSSLATILESRIRGVTVVGDNASGMHVMSYRQSTEHAFTSVRGGCLPTVYLDGVQLVDDTGRGPNLDLISLSAIGGIEYYSPSEIPVQYKSSGAMGSPYRAGMGARGESPGAPVATSPSCGVMLIWTRP